MPRCRRPVIGFVCSESDHALCSYTRFHTLRTYSDLFYSRRLKSPRLIEDEEILGIVRSLDIWKEGLPKHGVESSQKIPMLTPDRLLKGYYMVSKLKMILTSIDRRRP